MTENLHFGGRKCEFFASLLPHPDDTFWELTVVPLFLKLPCFSHSLQPAAPAAANRRSLFASKPRDDLTACPMCDRNFAEDRIDKGLACSRSLSTFKLILLEILQSYTG